MNQVVDDAGMIGLTPLPPLQKRRRLELALVGRVGEIHRLEQRQRVEHRGLAVVRVLGVQSLHRGGISARAGSLIDRVVPVEERSKGLDPVALPRGPGHGCACFLDRVPSAREQRRREGRRQRVRPRADRHSPVRHAARRLAIDDRLKGLFRLGIEERMQHRHGAIELRLHGGTAGGLEVDRTEMLGGGVIVSRLRCTLFAGVRRDCQADAGEHT